MILEEIKSRKGNSKLFPFDMTDYSNSIPVKLFPRRNRQLEGIKETQWVRVEGPICTERSIFQRTGFVCIHKQIQNRWNLIERRHGPG